MTEIEETLRALIRKRGTIKAQLTLFEKYVLPFESLDIETVHKLKVLDLQHRVTSADALYHKFDSIQSEIECTADDEYNQYSEREDFENKYYCLMAKANSFLKEYESKSLAISDSSSVGTNNNTQFKGVKLPEIKLPKFDGSYDTWLEFRDIFESLIHCNTEINPIQKFHYLRASLVGSAARVVQALEFTANNYDTAWSVLCDRYSNEKILVQNHLKAIVNHETIQSASSIKIRNLYENLCKHVSSLNQLGEPTDSWDTILIFIMSGKLDKITSQEWEKQRANLQNVKLTDFKDFLKARANLLETIEYNFEKQNIQNKPRNVTTKGLLSQSETVIKGNHSNGRNSCLYCKNDHSLFHCPNFLKLAIKDRFAKAKEMRLCLNCLRQNHMAKNCSWNGCKTCGQKHNSILHFPKANTNAAMSIGQDEVVEREESSTNCTLAVAQHALLSTAQVQVRETKNSSNFVTVRALLDSGSQSSFITSSLCERLNLLKTTVKLAISGISENISYANQRCNINIRSINDAYSFNLSCFVLDKITNDIPERAIDIANLNIPLQIKLADPEFHIPQRVDMLIGADAFWQLLIIGRINLENTSILLQNTRLGWLVAGSMSEPAVKTRCNLSHNISVQEQLTKFWEVEEIDVKRSLTIEEEACEEHFVEHVAKSNDGRYIVDLPLKEAPENLGDSRVTAIKRFESLEKRFVANDVYRKLYTDFLLEYERLGHMSEVTDNGNDSEPHHGVLKESSNTTKLRVVFDASAPTSTGVSLNDLQMTGPIIQQDLLSIILRFRLRSIVLSSDVKIMYRQIWINPKQRNLQKIVWRSDPSETMRVYELNTVTYGTTAASFLAVRCLNQIAFECEEDHPEIANVIKNNMYVDDLLTSIDTAEEAIYVCKNIYDILLKRGFELRKWKTNKPEIFESLNDNHESGTVEFSSDKDCNGKILGLSWRSDDDVLTYNIRKDNGLENNKLTKRAILSRIATIFDPLGLVNPSIMVAKMLLQKLWSEKLTWDEPLPDHIRSTWLKFSSELHALNNFVLPRQVTCDKPAYLSLHGFADASEGGYGACVYLVSNNNENNRKSHLLCAKSRVAPIKSLTIPRLELCAALVLSQLINKVLNSIDMKVDAVHYWTDSTIVLGWLRTSPNSLKTFVSNRVAEIQKLTHSFEWRHVPSCDNPADIVSRGLYPKQLVESKMWFCGPRWLLSESDSGLI